jgi:hypothetical protein
MRSLTKKKRKSFAKTEIYANVFPVTELTPGRWRIRRGEMEWRKTQSRGLVHNLEREYGPMEKISIWNRRNALKSLDSDE